MSNDPKNDTAPIKIPGVPTPAISIAGVGGNEVGTLAVDQQEAFMARALLLLGGVKPETMLINGGTKMDKDNWRAAYDDAGPIKVAGKNDATLKSDFQRGKELYAKLTEAADKKGLKLGQPLFRFSGSYKSTTAPDGRFVTYFPVTNMPASDEASLQQVRQPIDELYASIGGTPASGGVGARDGLSILDFVTSPGIDRVHNLKPKVDAALNGGSAPAVSIPRPVTAAPSLVPQPPAENKLRLSIQPGPAGHAAKQTPPAETHVKQTQVPPPAAKKHWWSRG